MKFQELDLTKKIRIRYWSKGAYVELKIDDCDRFKDEHDEDTNDIVCNNLMCEDWEYFEESEPKKRYWLWDVKNGKDVFKTSIYYDDSGYSPSRTMSIEKDLLIRKMENEFIEI